MNKDIGEVYLMFIQRKKKNARKKIKLFTNWMYKRKKNTDYYWTVMRKKSTTDNSVVKPLSYYLVLICFLKQEQLLTASAELHIQNTSNVILSKNKNTDQIQKYLEHLNMDITFTVCQKQFSSIQINQNAFKTKTNAFDLVHLNILTGRVNSLYLSH